MKQPLSILVIAFLCLCNTSLSFSVTDAELEALEKALEQQEADEKRKAEEKAKETARKRQEVKEKARIEAEAKRKAEEEAARQAELKREAEREAARQAEIKRQFEEKAAKEAEQHLLIKTLAGEFINVPAGTLDIAGRIIEVAPFQMGRHEITQGQWQQVMGNNPSSKKGCDECPVEFVSWHDVQAFIRTLNKKTGEQFRLPTISEWEYACASGKDANRCLGHNIHAMVLSRRGETKPIPVTGETANVFGLKGMDSNAWEWTCSAYKENYDGTEKECVNKKDLNATRAVRGGASIDMTTKEVDDVKLWNNSNLRFDNIGFRLVKE